MGGADEDKEPLRIPDVANGFLDSFLAKAEVDLPTDLGDPQDTANWPAYRAWMAEVIASRTRAEWVSLFDGDDDCVQPVLDLTEAPNHPHLQARDAFTDVGGTTQPSPAPRFGVPTAMGR